PTRSCQRTPPRTSYYTTRLVPTTETTTPPPLGPERPTILERVIGMTHLPYSLGCLVFSAALGGPGIFLIFYLDTFNLGEAWRRTVSTAVFSVTPDSQIPA